MDIRAVGFDIDGTLYPSSALYWRMIPRTIGHLVFLLRYNKLRTKLRDAEFLAKHGFASVNTTEAFHKKEAELLALKSGSNVEALYTVMETCIYEKSENMFRHIKLYDGVRELLAELRNRGLRLGALSDFPAGKKLEYLGIEQYFDVIMTSEETGMLKPFAKPFEVFADRLGVKPAEMLYVGNSERYDVRGAKNTGMKTAYINPRARPSSADFVFAKYTQLTEYINKLL